jgi:hypothetical protein
MVGDHLMASENFSSFVFFCGLENVLEEELGGGEKIVFLCSVCFP